MTSTNKIAQPKFVVTEMNDSGVPEGAPAILVTARAENGIDAQVSIINSGSRADFASVETLVEYLRKATISAELTVKYVPNEPKDGEPAMSYEDRMNEHNQSPVRILLPASTVLKDKELQSGGAEAVYRLTLKGKRNSTYQLDIRVDQFPTLYTRKFSNAYPVAPSFIPRYGLPRIYKQAYANLEFQVASRFMMNVSAPVKDGSREAPGSLVPMWTCKGEGNVSDKYAATLKLFATTDEAAIGEVRKDSQGREWLYQQVRYEPARTPRYSAALILATFGYALTRRTGEYNVDIKGFISGDDLFAQVFPGITVEKCAVHSDSIRQFRPTEAGIEVLKGRREAAAAAAVVAQAPVAAGIADDDDLPFFTDSRGVEWDKASCGDDDAAL